MQCSSKNISTTINELSPSSIAMTSRLKPPSDTSASGYTLIEVMVVTAIIAIVLTVAVPSYTEAISQSRITNEINDLRAHLEFARSEAMKRGQTVVVCPSTDATNCSNSQSWATGWIIFATSDSTVGGCSVTNSGGNNIPLKKRDGITSTNSITFTPFTSANRSICFTRLGLLAADYTGWFSFNASPASSTTNRCLTLSTAGRAQTVKNGSPVTTGINCS